MLRHKDFLEINHRQKGLMTIRVYQYFQNNKDTLLYCGIDSYLKPTNIGRINQKNSDNLKRKIYNLLH